MDIRSLTGVIARPSKKLLRKLLKTREGVFDNRGAHDRFKGPRERQICISFLPLVPRPSWWRPNFGVKLARPGSARRPSRLLHRQRDGVTAVAVCQSVLRTSLAATAAPLCRSHAGPAVQLTPRTLGGLIVPNASRRARLSVPQHRFSRSCALRSRRG